MHESGHDIHARKRIIHENPESAEVSSEFWMQSILTSILKGFLKEHLLWTCWCRFLVQDGVSFPLLSCSWQEEQSERKNAGAGSDYWSAQESRVEAVIFLKNDVTDAVNQTAWDQEHKIHCQPVDLEDPFSAKLMINWKRRDSKLLGLLHVADC